MELRMDAQELNRLDRFVHDFNAKINIDGRKPQQQLGKDDFLKLLIT